MSTDLTFLTNEQNERLVDRFKVLINDTRLFDCLVGYFYASGFYELYPQLEKTEKIRILIGLKTDRPTFDLVEEAKQLPLPDSHAEIRSEFARKVENEMEGSPDNANVEDGVHKFIDWIRKGKLEIRAYNDSNLHAKLYIMTFKEGDRDRGRVITGSSNFSRSGLSQQLEFNVELKTPADYDFAQKRFNDLWEKSAELSEQFVDTIAKKTWLSTDITPYELYLKFLYEYFKDQLSPEISPDDFYVPEGFLELEYQREAVSAAYKIVKEYGGVFLSDVVGLGKTYMSALLAQQLTGRTLVIAPPTLLDKDNPGSWPSVLSDFRVAADTESLGQLERLLDRGVDKYTNIIIDESHRFRTEDNKTYESLAKICAGKRVILVSATPFNNTPKDIFSQIKLFQKPRKSDVPGLPNLEEFFVKLERRVAKLDRAKDADKYLKATQENAKDIREKVLRYLMVRRTRQEISEFYGEDLKNQGLSFPEVADPTAVYYQLDTEEDRVFTETLSLIKELTYTRYQPMLYYLGEVGQSQKQAQVNLGKFMEILLVKRLESSFYAFKKTIDRFITSHERVLEEFDNGRVFVSKDYATKIFSLLEAGDEDSIQKLVDAEGAQVYEAKEFRKDFRANLEQDLDALRQIQKLWKGVKRDPKLEQLIAELKDTEVLRTNKVVLFTESGETADYLLREVEKAYPGKVLHFTGSVGEERRRQVIANFDARARNKSDQFRILITTDVLAEGVNLHRSNVVVNYDIPWNPTRMMQRVGRVNRVDTDFDKIYSFNFFPTAQANTQIKLKEAAESKIRAFIEMLGADAKLLTEGEEIKSHDLFQRLTSKTTIMGEEEGGESELKYLGIIRDVRDKQPDVFARIKQLPKKARVAKNYDLKMPMLLTYFRKGRLERFFLSGSGRPREIDFLEAAKVFEADPKASARKTDETYFKLLEQNKRYFSGATEEGDEEEVTRGKGGRDATTRLLQILRSAELREYQGFTDEDDLFLGRVIKALEEGIATGYTRKTVLKKLNEEIDGGKATPLRILSLLRKHFPDEFGRAAEVESDRSAGPREVILSEYLLPKKQ